MPNKTSSLRHATILITYLFVVWGFYRFLIRFPDVVEELFIKPAFWLTPTLFFLYRENLGLKSIGLTLKRFFPTLYLVIGLGCLFAAEGILVNYLKYGQLQFNANLGDNPFVYSLGLSFVTALTEEITFRGYIFSRLWNGLKNEWAANAITSVSWAAIHVPIAAFVWKLDAFALVTYLILILLYGFGAAFLYARTKNVLACTLLHVFWQWPIILFR